MNRAERAIERRNADEDRKRAAEERNAKRAAKPATVNSEAGVPDQPILRSDIRGLSPQSASLMPSGFESALKPQDLADLLAWIRGE